MSIFQVITVTRLPETLGKPMLTSIDEAEEFYADPEGKNSEKRMTLPLTIKLYLISSRSQNYFLHTVVLNTKVIINILTSVLDNFRSTRNSRKPEVNR